MRVAALAFGVLAGLVASLILALGGLDVASAVAASADRQTQAIRFGLLVIANLGIFGAALVLAAPLIGGILLLAGAMAWVGAALLLGHTTDFVLILPPALMLVASVFSIIAFFRRPILDDMDPDVEIISPLRGERYAERQEMEDDEDPGVAMPSFGAEQRSGRPQQRSRDDDRPRRANADNWDPRKRRPPPPRARPNFRPLDEDDEPSGFSRFARGVSSLLSFGLYAGLAGAAVLVIWNVRSGDVAGPSAAAIDTPAAISSQPTAAPSSEQPPAPTLSAPSEGGAAAAQNSALLSPLRIGGPARVVTEQPAAAAPAAEDNFGDVVMSDDPLSPPRLAQDFGVGFDESTVPSAEPVDLEPDAEPAEDPLAASPEEPLQATGEATTGGLMPFQMTARMAALRTAPGTGPRPVQSQPAPASDSGI